MARVLKWNVPVDDLEHEIGGGDVVHIAVQHPDLGSDVVQVWTKEHFTTPNTKRNVQVVGTGHQFPDYWPVLGSAICANGSLVWHVVEVKGV